jgi:protein ImuB
MFAVIYLPQFSLQSALRHEPELWTKPVALVDPERSTPVVCETTDAAAASHVSEGLTSTQALARCRDVVIRHRSPAQEASATEVLLQCAYGFSPHIESTAPGLCTLDLQGLSALSAGEPTALAACAEQLRTALVRLNLRARVGIGPTPNLARHAARWAKGVQIVDDAETFVRSLPVVSLAPSTDVALVLDKWGIRTVGQLLALGQEALVERFGLEALALFAASSTTAVRPLNLVRPTQQYEESFEFTHEVETIEPLLFVLRRFVDYLSQRLELTGLVAELLRLRLRLESGEAVERCFRLPQPSRRAEVLFRLLHTFLETLRTQAPIVAVALKAEPTRPEQKQFTLFGSAMRDPHQFQETLARLSALLGADRVGTPVLEDSHRPDAFRLVPPDFENTPAATARGTELLQPIAIRRFRPAVKALVDEGSNEPERRNPAPLAIKCSIVKGKLKAVIGP